MYSGIKHATVQTSYIRGRNLAWHQGGYDMDIPSPQRTHAAICDQAFSAERNAWSRVAGHLPGQADFDPQLWNAWLDAVSKAGEAARLGSAIADEPDSLRLKK